MLSMVNVDIVDMFEGNVEHLEKHALYKDLPWLIIFTDDSGGEYPDPVAQIKLAAILVS